VKKYLHSLLECQDCKISGENYISNECNTCESDLKSTKEVLRFIDGKYQIQRLFFYMSILVYE
jgi:hypothetical protein